MKLHCTADQMFNFKTNLDLEESKLIRCKIGLLVCSWTKAPTPALSERRRFESVTRGFAVSSPHSSGLLSGLQSALAESEGEKPQVWRDGRTEKEEEDKG